MMAFTKWDIGGCGCSPYGLLICGSYEIPERDLTCAYDNPMIGDGVVTLTYNSLTQLWSYCFTALATLIQLSCISGVPNFCAYFYTGPGCGGSEYTGERCCTGAAHPRIPLTSYTASPFEMVFTTSSSGCPLLWINGFRTFTLT